MQPGEGAFHGGPGNDVVVGSLAGDKVELDEGGFDVVCGNGGNDVLLGFSAGVLLGCSGSDDVRGFDETVLIDCGAAYELFRADAGVEVRRCEGASPR